MFRLLTTVIGISLLLASFNTWARDYQLELFVFQRLNSSEEIEEHWTHESNQVVKHQQELKAISTSSTVIADQNVAGVNRLKRLEDNLLKSGYRVLHSMHWQQPAKQFHQAPIIRINNPANGLDGVLKVYKTALILADINLGFTDTFQQNPDPIYFIQEKRRMKFKEVHYFDHPRYGAILTVWPAD